jgi:serine/threonine protein kinase
VAVDSPCRGAEAFQQYLLGSLPDEQAAALEAHLLECDRCAWTIGQLAERDPLVPAFQGTSAVEPDEESAHAVRELMQRLFGQAPAERSPTAAAWETDLGGSILADFRIEGEIGRGGMGIVYQAVQISLGRKVALKVLPFAATLDAKHLQRFQNEAQAAAQLHHGNIVPVFASGCERGIHYYAMQFIEGQSLAQVVVDLRLQIADGKNGRKSAEETARIGTVAQLGIQAAEALEHAHQFGITHRDIKPGNLLVENKGREARGEGRETGPLVPRSSGHTAHLWVTDFGLAHIQAQAGPTRTGDLLGTLCYMSPEQALGKRPLMDQRTDIYALGATLYELSTLEPVFKGNDRQELLRQIAFEEPRPPRQLNRAIPADLETILLKALEKNPAERYATALEMADDLRRFLADQPIQARRPTWTQRLRKWARRHQPAVATGAISAALLVVFAFIFLFISNRQIAEERNRKEEALQQSKTSEETATRRLRETLRALDRMLTRVPDDRLSDVSMDPERKAFYEEALEFYQRMLRESSTDPQLRLETIRAYYLMGKIRRIFGQFRQAEEPLRQAIALAESALQQGLTEPEYREQIALGRQALGNDLGPLFGLYGKAEQELSAALDLWRELAAKNPKDQRYHLHIVECQGSLARKAAELGQTGKAEQLIRQTLDAHEQLKILFPHDHDLRRERAWAWRTLAHMLSGRGQDAEREKACRRALAEAQEIPRNTFNFYALVGAQRDLGSVLLARGKQGEGEGLLARSTTEAQQLIAAFPSTPFAHRELGLSRMTQGRAFEARGNLAEAAKAYEQAAEQFVQAMRFRPDTLEERWQALEGYDDLADVLHQMGRRAEAEKARAKAEEILRQCLDERGELFGNRLRLGNLLQNRAGRIGYLGRIAEMEPLYEQALRLYEKEAEAATTAEQSRAAQMSLALAWGQRGEYRRRHGFFREGAEAQRRSVAVLEKLAGAFPDDREVRSRLAQTHGNLAWILSICPEPRPEDGAAAVQHALKAVELEPEEHDRWHTLGAAYCRQRQWKEALAALTKSRQLEKSSEPPTSFDLFFKAMAHSGLGDMPNARRSYEEGVKWMEKNLPEHADLRRFRSEAEQMLGRETRDASREISRP